ncbi:aminoglycoside phosphotransferase family protein [Kribbella sp. NBC_01245]|uniref:phosphotransferase family protein n=1 Tax=Kribbella sp. NBC_01245 TaxID=2903578 RepID=UPI002E288C8D|nr:aminoglycoside phosphotransferase family protein [Kribbella sp. NBC_01245]
MQIEKLVAEALPDHQVLEVLPRTGGELSTVFEVRLDAEPTAVIVKVYADEWAWKQVKEVYVYSLLKSSLSSVPEVLYVGAGYTVLTKLEGVPLSQVEVAPEDWYDVYHQLGQLVRRFHGVAQPAYGYVVEEVLDPKPDNTSYMAGQFAKKLQEFADLGGAADLHDRIESYVAHHSHLLAKATDPVLCHNDVHEGNVLVVPGASGWRITGLIDVENAIAADPLMDLAKTDCYSIRNNQHKLDGLLAGYGDLPPDWQPRMTLYRLYHALELWDWFASTNNPAPLPSIASDLTKIVG